MKVAGYVRVSTQKQCDDGVSIEMQKERIIGYAKAIEVIKHMDEIEFFIDEGYSAKSLDRPAMMAMIEKIKERKIDIVIAYDMSRMSRDIFDLNELFKLMKKYMVTLKCLYDNPKIDTASDRLVTNIKILNNQHERERIVERTNDCLLSIVEKGRYPNGGKMPYGYKRGSDKDIYIEDEEAQVVKIMYQMAADIFLDLR